MRSGAAAFVGALTLVVALAIPVGAAAVVRPPGPAGLGTELATDAVAVPQGAGSAPLPAATPVAITLTLRGPDPAGLAAYAARTGAGTAPYLTEAEFAERFAPTPAQVATVRGFLAAHGAAGVTVTPDGFGVSGVLPASGVEAAFGVGLVAYGGPASRPLYTATGPAALPATLAPLVAGVGGLSDWADPWYSGELAVVAPPAPVGPAGPGAFVVDNTTGLPWFLGSDFAQAYGVDQLFPTNATVAHATFPTGEAVATILMSGYNQTTQANLPGFDPTAVAAYFNDTFPADWPHPLVTGVPVTIGNLTPPPPGGSGAIGDSSLSEVENALDVEMAGSLAPGATVVNFYFAGSLLSGPATSTAIGDVADDFAQSLAEALAYNYSGARLDAVTNSYGLPDLNNSLWNTELLHAAALGVTVVAASGDQGNAPPELSGRLQGQWPSWPASAVSGAGATVAVGGTTVTLTGRPAGSYNGSVLAPTFDPTVGGVATATAWYDAYPGSGNVSGTEGGASTVFPEPAWQFDSAAQPAIVNATVLQGLGRLGRAEPDIALAANATVAYTASDASGVYFEVLAGTSVASPLLAGLLASAAAVAGHPFGVLDPELYRIASYYAANPGPGDPFEDVVAGRNFVFAAAPGWDATTGWGQLSAPRFLAADANGSVAGYVYAGPTPGLPPPAASPAATPPFVALAILGLALALAVAAVIVFGRPRTPRGPPSSALPPVFGGYGGPPPGYGAAPAPGPLGAPGPGTGPGPSVVPATFACPYCGRPRPAEPVRCPSCGVL